MRFERRLLAQRREDPEWVDTYIDYSSLKLSVYAAASGQCVDFHALLRDQASAASSFFQRKCEELLERVSKLEQIAKDEGGSQWARKQLVSDISPELRSLRSFALLNYTAVIKAAKKWNKNVPDQQVDAHEVLKKQPFFSGPQLPRLVSRAEVLAGKLAPSGSTAATDFQCPICFGVLHNPVVLACTHRFDFACIAPQGASQGSECPVCRKPVDFENGELEVDPTLDDFICRTFPRTDNISTSNSCKRLRRSVSPYKRKALLVGIDCARPDALLSSRCPTLASLIEGGGAYGISMGSPGTSREDCASDQAFVWRTILSGKRAGRPNPSKSALDEKTSSLTTSTTKAVTTVAASGEDEDDDANELNASSIFDMIASELPTISASVLASSGGLCTEHSSFSQQVPNDSSATSEACKRVDKDLVVVQLDAARRAGLSKGFGPQHAAYREALEAVDDHCARLMRAVYSRMESHKDEEWLFMVVTANPIKTNGKTSSEPEDCAVMLAGAGVKQGKELNHKPTNLDVCPTLLHHFGVPPRSVWALEGRVLEALKSSESKAGQDRLGCQPEMHCLSLPPMPPSTFANLPGISDVGSFAIVGHRGAGANNAPAMASGSKRPKENTVESFTLAQRLGASWIETDVQFTRDGVPVIEHEFEVQTTDGDVIDLRELSLCELEEVKGEVLQLDDALDRSPEGLAFNLELKYRPDVPPSATALEGEIETLLNVAEQQIKKRRIAYSSFAQEPLAVLSRMQAMWPVFALASRAGGGAESVENALDSAKRNGLSGIVGNVRMLQAEPSLVSMIKAEGLLLMSYGEANTDPSVLPEQVRWGVCGVITDDVPIVEEVSRKLAPPLKK